MVEQRVSEPTGAALSRWGHTPQEAFIGILDNAAFGQEARPGPVRKRGFVVLAHNAQSLQAVQEWCLHKAQSDCLAARYRIKSGPVFGTLFAALSDDSKQMQAERSSAPGLGAKRQRRGSVHFRPEGSWPEQIKQGFFEDKSYTSDVGVWLGGEQGTTTSVKVTTMLSFLAGVLTGDRRLVVLAEVIGEPDPDEWEAAKAGLFGFLPEPMGLVLAGAPDGFSLPEDDPHYLELNLAGVEAPPSSVNANVYQLAALSSDRPSHDDRLGVQRYADALAQFVLHPGTTPLAVAIHGPWGKGKSTFMQLVRQSLLRVAMATTLDEPIAAATTLDEPMAERHFGAAGQLRRLDRARPPVRKPAPRSVRQQVVTVEFNAWRFQDSTQIWAGLASAITSGLEEALPWWRRLLTPVAYAWRSRRAQLIAELVLPAVTAVLILVLAAFGIPLLRGWLERQLESNALAKLFGGVVPAAGAAVASFWLVASRTRQVLQPVSERVLTYVRRPDYREQMGYQHRVLDDVRFVTKRLRGDRAEPRVFVFIDDLDRCSTEKIVEILQAINLILGESDFYVFLGIHTEMIYRAINAHYAADGRPPEPRFAETYLQKIVQLPFHLPETPEDQRASFVAGLFSDAARAGALEGTGVGDGPSADPRQPLALAWDRRALDAPDVAPKPVEDTPIELQAFLDFLPYLEDNPREIKRLVNIHRFVKIILQREGRPASTEIQRKLVKWLIFCNRWPNLVDGVLVYASRNLSSVNPIADKLANVESEAREFAGKTGPDDVLTADDLAPGGPLAHAASISHLVLWESAAGQAAHIPTS